MDEMDCMDDGRKTTALGAARQSSSVRLASGARTCEYVRIAMDLKTVGTFGTPWEAGMAKSILEAEGIPALIDGETMHVVVLPGIAPPSIKLLVAEDAFERAQEILRRWDESKVPLDESADAEDWSAPPEGAGCDEPEDE
jgi:hypothetical protein